MSNNQEEKKDLHCSIFDIPLTTEEYEELRKLCVEIPLYEIMGIPKEYFAEEYSLKYTNGQGHLHIESKTNGDWR